MMKYIKSCGVIAYKKFNTQNYYLIIKSTNGDIGFPKGHMESDESEVMTAVRELKEETNVEAELLSDFRYQIEYKMPNIDGAIKQSVYFLGKCISDKIICQENEVLEAKFVSYEEALKILTFEETKEILRKVEEYLSIIGKTVKVIVDRPLGSYHPKFKDIFYSVNYGYIEGIIAGDNEEQDAYILGVNEAVKEFTGGVVAVIHRLDDIEDKWVVAPEGVNFTKEEVEKEVEFQEKYFKTEIIM